jgi:NAD(P)-dependent dehydrogenase (short-subunit alcohol dehydrogenase family)
MSWSNLIGTKTLFGHCPVDARKGDEVMELDGKIALVTGAGSGIGKATALALASEGAKVAVLSRTESEVSKTRDEIAAAGGEAIALTADTSDETAMRRAIGALVTAFGGLDIVVANAGINGVWAPIDDLQPDEWDKTMAVNLRGTYLTLHLTVPHLKVAGGGSIVVVSSINGTRTFTTPGATAYAATKAGQLAMVQQLALELGRHRIRVNAVCPGAIDTSISDNTASRHTDETEIPVVWPEGEIPISGGEAGHSSDVAEAILFLATDRARHITGTPIWIDGGQGLLR